MLLLLFAAAGVVQCPHPRVWPGAGQRRPEDGGANLRRHLQRRVSRGEPRQPRDLPLQGEE